jgi:UDP-N-acetylglucosamine 2-epimerase (non-hydrolysing)
MKKSIGIILGTRPEAVKCAPIIWALRADPGFNLVVSTGQHREMLDETLTEFEIVPDVQLAVMRKEQTLSQITHRIIEGLGKSRCLAGLDAVMVHGDTATTLAGALAGLHHQVPVVHIEAGLRRGNIRSPYPEEANRKLVGQIAALHLAPTPGNAGNLIREGVDERRIAVTGNTVVDALRWGIGRVSGYGSPKLADLDTDPRRVVLATAHRRESWGNPMEEIAQALAEIARRDDVRVIVPLHYNPAVRKVMRPVLEGIDNITITDPLPYLYYCSLLNRSYIVVSDSSGAEEEGPSLGKPTLVLRDITERHESVCTGAARLVSRTRGFIVSEVNRLLDDPTMWHQMADAMNPYGDGRAAERSVAALAHFLDLGPAIQPFVAGHVEVEFDTERLMAQDHNGSPVAKVVAA